MDVVLFMTITELCLYHYLCQSVSELMNELFVRIKSASKHKMAFFCFCLLAHVVKTYHKNY